MLSKFEAFARMLETVQGNASAILHTVRWQRHLLGAKALRERGEARFIIEQSDAYISRFTRRIATADHYPLFVWSILHAWRDLSASRAQRAEEIEMLLSQLASVG